MCACGAVIMKNKRIAEFSSIAVKKCPNEVCVVQLDFS